MKRKGKAYLAGDCSGDERAQRDGHRATTTRYSLLLCVLFFSVWCVCPSLFFFFFVPSPLGSLSILSVLCFSSPMFFSPFLLRPLLSVLLLDFFSLCFGPLFLGLPVFLSCSALFPVQWLLKMELWSCYWRRSITVSPFVSLFSLFF
jgi:hypothetical protein